MSTTPPFGPSVSQDAPSGISLLPSIPSSRLPHTLIHLIEEIASRHIHELGIKVLIDEEGLVDRP
jgi:hypothetical protein